MFLCFTIARFVDGKPGAEKSFLFFNLMKHLKEKLILYLARDFE